MNLLLNENERQSLRLNANALPTKKKSGVKRSCSESKSWSANEKCKESVSAQPVQQTPRRQLLVKLWRRDDRIWRRLRRLEHLRQLSDLNKVLIWETL